MKFDIISFDLQGTLSDAKFSDEFWLETLPKIYSNSQNIEIEQSKERLKKEFATYGKYDYRYYSFDYWINRLDPSLTFNKVCSMMKNKPYFYKDSINLIKKLQNKAKLIIVSSTTKEFIDIEMKENKKYFDHIYSSLDNFNIAGKPTGVYEKIAQKLGVKPGKIIHIGNCMEMDIKNAKKAGYKTIYVDEDISRKENISNLNCKIFE